MSALGSIEAVSCGATFYRADLHIHSYGASADVKDATMTPVNIVQTALKEGLGLIAVTDHDSIRNVSATVEAAKDTGVVVIPGIELSTPEGHLLVYCDSVETLSAFRGKLAIVDEGKQTSRCQTSMLDCLNKLDTAKSFAVLAHVDVGGFEEKTPGMPPHKMDILCHRSLVAIELAKATCPVCYSKDDPDPQRQQVEQSRVQRIGEGCQATLARVMSSDSHTLAALGRNALGNRRLTRFKMDTPGFQALRVALQFADARVRLEDEIPESIPFVKGVTIQGGFLDGQVIHFSRNLNCIIGGRGAGKSTAFETVRCISASGTPNPVIDSEAWAECVNLVWQDGAAQLHTVMRRHSDQVRNVNDSDAGPVEFVMESYGQGETAQLSQQAKKDPAAILGYLDNFIDITLAKTTETATRDELLSNQSDIEKAELEVAKIPEYKRRLGVVREQLKALQQANFKDLVNLERQVAEERSIRQRVSEDLETLDEHLSMADAKESLDALLGLADPAALKIGGTPFKAIHDSLTELKGDVRECETKATDALKACRTAVTDALRTWKASELTIVDQIETKRKELAEKGVKLDLAFVRKLAKDEADYVAALASLAEWTTYLQQLQQSRKTLLDKLSDNRKAIYAARLKFAMAATKALSGALNDLAVSVQFIEGGWSPEAEQHIQNAMGWRTIQVPRAAVLVRKLTVKSLLIAIQSKDVKPLTALLAEDGSKAFSDATAMEVLDRLSEPAHRFALERCAVEDLPRVIVTKRRLGTDGKANYVPRDFALLSLGQQQSVLLALMLSSDSSAPLLIDQPEDNLDGEFIYSSLIPVLRRAKERRQVIIVTHNPNIAVLGDAEQIIAIKSMSDKGRVVQSGSIDNDAIRKVTCQILEGAEAAFRQRSRVYGLS